MKKLIALVLAVMLCLTAITPAIALDSGASVVPIQISLSYQSDGSDPTVFTPAGHNYSSYGGYDDKIITLDTSKENLYMTLTPTDFASQVTKVEFVYQENYNTHIVAASQDGGSYKAVFPVAGLAKAINNNEGIMYSVWANVPGKDEPIEFIGSINLDAFSQPNTDFSNLAGIYQGSAGKLIIFDNGTAQFLDMPAADSKVSTEISYNPDGTIASAKVRVYTYHENLTFHWDTAAHTLTGPGGAADVYTRDDSADKTAPVTVTGSLGQASGGGDLGYTIEGLNFNELSTLSSLNISSYSSNKSAITAAMPAGAKLQIMSFSHDGALPATAQVTMAVDSAVYPDGAYYLYYYNASTGAAELQRSVTVTGGKFSFSIDHCSDYFLSDVKAVGDIAPDYVRIPLTMKFAYNSDFSDAQVLTPDQYGYAGGYDKSTLHIDTTKENLYFRAEIPADVKKYVDHLKFSYQENGTEHIVALDENWACSVPVAQIAKAVDEYEGPSVSVYTVPDQNGNTYQYTARVRLDAFSAPSADYTAFANLYQNAAGETLSIAADGKAVYKDENISPMAVSASYTHAADGSIVSAQITVPTYSKNYYFSWDAANKTLTAEEGNEVFSPAQEAQKQEPLTISGIAGSNSSGRPLSYTIAGLAYEDIADGTVDYTMSTTSPNKDTVTGLMPAGADIMMLSFAHDGALPKTISLTIAVDSALFPDGDYYLYYYNQGENKTELQQKVTVADGKFTFSIDHCSDYFLSDVKAAGDVTPEEKFLDAIAAANAGDTVALTENVTLTSGLTINKNLVLDLAGFTLTGTVTVASPAQLTIKDSTQEKAGKLESDGNGTLIVNEGAAAILESGTINNTALSAVQNAGTFTMKHGAVKSAEGAIVSTGASTVSIEGGNVTGGGTAYAIVLGDSTTLHMTGGYVKGSYGISSGSNAAITMEDVWVTAEGADGIAVSANDATSLTVGGNSVIQGMKAGIQYGTVVPVITGSAVNVTSAGVGSYSIVKTNGTAGSFKQTADGPEIPVTGNIQNGKSAVHIALTDTEVIYSGTSQGLGVIDATDGIPFVFTYTCAAPAYDSTTGPTEPGEYTVTASLSAQDAGKYVLDDASVTSAKFTVKKISVRFTMTDAQLTYNGQPQAFPAANIASYPLLAPTDYTLTYTSAGGYDSTTAPTEPGEYTVTATLNDTDHYEWSADSDAQAAFTIGKIAVGMALTNAELTYDGGAQALPADKISVDPQDAPYTLTYTSADGYDSTTAPTEPGVYTVTATLNDTDHYALSAGSTTQATLTIGKIVTKVELSDASGTATGSEMPFPAASISNPDGLNLVLTYTSDAGYNSATPPTEAGVYTVTAAMSVDDSAHYQFDPASKLVATFAIVPNKTTAKVELSDAQAVYNGGERAFPADKISNPQAAPLVLTYTSDAGYNSSTPPTEAGTYTVTAALTEAAQDDFVLDPDSKLSATFTVEKAPATVKLTDTNVNYSGNPIPFPAASISNPMGLELILTYTDAGGSASADAPVKAGTYTVTAALSEEAAKNFTLADDSDLTAVFTILKKNSGSGSISGGSGSSSVIDKILNALNPDKGDKSNPDTSDSNFLGLAAALAAVSAACVFAGRKRR